MGINVQDIFLNQARKQSIPITIHVMNGFQIKNALIKSYDNFVVLIEAEGRQMMIYKHAISTITPSREINMFEREQNDA